MAALFCGTNSQMSAADPIDRRSPRTYERRADDRCWRKAVISQANRKQMRWTVHLAI